MVVAVLARGTKEDENGIMELLIVEKLGRARDALVHAARTARQWVRVVVQAAVATRRLRDAL
jgi:hypothetical protein